MAASKSPLPYTGNKSCIVETILNVMPEHTVYIEPCMGSAELFFRKPKARLEILNDYNGDLVNLFRVIQSKEKLAELLGRLCLSVNAEQLFRQNQHERKQIPNLLDASWEAAQYIDRLSWEDVRNAAAFLENQVYSFSSTGQSFGIARRDITMRLGRIISAHSRLRDAIILHRDYKDVIAYGAAPGAFIFLDPPYRNTEGMYQKAAFDESEHGVLFELMGEIHQKHRGQARFLITYNNDPLIRELADAKGFYSLVLPRLHNMRQAQEAGALFEELLIANYDLTQQAEQNQRYLYRPDSQMTLFEYNTDYMEESPNAEIQKKP